MVDLGIIVMIHDLKKQGLSISSIAQKAGLDRKTVRKYLDRGLEAPVYGPRASGKWRWTSTGDIWLSGLSVFLVCLPAGCTGS